MKQMKNLTLLVFSLLITVFVSAQEKDSIDLREKMEQIDNTVENIRKENKRLRNEVSLLNKEIEKLSSKTDSTLEADRHSSKVRINNLSREISQIDSVKVDLSKKTDSQSSSIRWGIICITIFIVIIAVVLYELLYKRLGKDKKSTEKYLQERIEENKKSMEEHLVKDFSEQFKILNELLDIILLLKTPDHSLALKLADEINLMERNIRHMDPDTRGLKQLNRSITNLKDKLAEKGYEIPELLGKPYNQGMNVRIVNSIPDENLKKEEEIITKIIKPQVNYNDRMIQSAQIEVSVGY
jgi:predicted RNase H-like nuclease (RuvC/YqgF family)